LQPNDIVGVSSQLAPDVPSVGFDDSYIGLEGLYVGVDLI
jgi:hypothetical protein